MIKKFRLKDETLNQYGTGYVPDKRYNERFGEQGLNCPYEHCIETMPLLKDEAIKAVEKEMIIDLRKDPMFHIMDKNRIREIPKEKPELYKKIRALLDKREIKDDECWFYPNLNNYISEFGNSPDNCKLYGHQCPGGGEQVKECNLEGIFN